MPDILYEAKDRIESILGTSQRLTYVLDQRYSVTASSITAIRVDGDNRKIDVRTADETFRFKPKSPSRILMKDPDSGNMLIATDPALAQGIYNIVEDFAG